MKIAKSLVFWCHDFEGNGKDGAKFDDVLFLKSVGPFKKGQKFRRMEIDTQSLRAYDEHGVVQTVKVSELAPDEMKALTETFRLFFRLKSTLH